MDASEIKVPRGVTRTQKFHPALGMQRVLPPKPEEPKPQPEKFHPALGYRMRTLAECDD
jgi:hypothetical protein